MTISRDDWLKALSEADTTDDPAALTTTEIAALLGLHREAARRRILLLVKAKRAIRTFKVVHTVTGVRLRVPAYRLITGGKK